MGLFKNVIGMGLGIEIFNDAPSLADKVEMLFTDVETEGKKRGYKKAANKYEHVFREIEAEYKETEELIKLQKNTYGTEADLLITKLSELERCKEDLEEQIKMKVKNVSMKYNIPVGDVNKSMATGALIMIGPIDILGLVYKHKEKKLKEAEQRGYIEAKNLYENKINKLKKKLSELKEKGSSEIKSLLSMIDDLFDEITKKYIEIAELEILL